jgi:hypothetical protein
MVGECDQTEGNSALQRRWIAGINTNKRLKKAIRAFPSLGLNSKGKVTTVDSQRLKMKTSYLYLRTKLSSSPGTKGFAIGRPHV